MGNGVIFAGKIAGNSLLAFMQAIIIILMTHVLFGVDWGGHPGLIIFALCTDYPCIHDLGHYCGIG